MAETDNLAHQMTASLHLQKRRKLTHNINIPSTQHRSRSAPSYGNAATARAKKASQRSTRRGATGAYVEELLKKDQQEREQQSSQGSRAPHNVGQDQQPQRIRKKKAETLDEEDPPGNGSFKKRKITEADGTGMSGRSLAHTASSVPDNGAAAHTTSRSGSDSKAHPPPQPPRKRKIDTTALPGDDEPPAAPQKKPRIATPPSASPSPQGSPTPTPVPAEAASPPLPQQPQSIPSAAEEAPSSSAAPAETDEQQQFVGTARKRTFTEFDASAEHGWPGERKKIKIKKKGRGVVVAKEPA